MLSDIINQTLEFMRKIKCDYHYVDNLVARYEEEGGYAIQLNEGSLASGDWILYDDTGKQRETALFTRRFSRTEVHASTSLTKFLQSWI